MRLAHFFIVRPRFAAVVSIVMVIVGALAYLRLPVTEYPEIAPPTIVVRAAYPGADAQTVAATVATPLEQEINGVEGMLYMSSYSTGDGSMALTITFQPGTDLDMAQVLVQNRVAAAEPRLPEEVRRLGVNARKSSPDLMMVVHMLSPNGTYDDLYVSNYALSRVRDQLIRLDGIGDVQVFGAREYAIRIWLDPERLASLGLTGGDVVRALREQNVQVTGGSLGQQPAPADAPFQLSVTTQGRFSDPRQFHDVIVRSTADGRIVRLQDVARVELGARDYNTNSYLNGQSAVGIALFQRPGSNALDAAAGVKARMDELKAGFPPDLDYRIVYNPTEFIQQSIDEVYKTLLEAVLLVALVVLVFLQSWRASLIPILAIPVSLIGTFAVMSAFGFTLNVLTLFGLVLAIGIVVDDAIVVVENIERNMANGLSSRDAAHRTMDEVGTAVIAIAVVLSAVFVPTAFVPGITGAFYRQFALTISVATVLSAFNSLTLSPALGAILLKRHAPGRQPGNPLARIGGAFARVFNGGFDRMSRGYGRSVGIVARRKVLMLLIYAGLGAATVYLGGRIPTGFIPQLDRGYAIVVVQLPDGASLGRTDEVVRKATDIMLATPGVRDAVGFAGFSGATFTNASNAGVVFASFQPFEERLKAGQTLQGIVGELFGRLQSIPEAFVIAVPPPAVPGIGSQGGFKLQLQNRTGEDVRPLLETAYQIMGRAAQTPGVQGVFTTFSANSPQVFLEIDRVKAQMLNVPIGNIFEALQVYLGTSYVNDFNAFGRIYQVRAQADQRFRLEQEDVPAIRVRSATGALVPLGTLVTLRETAGPELIQRYNQFVSVPIQGAAAPGVSSDQALAIMEGLAKDTLPPGISFEWTELALQQKLAGNTAVYIFGLSILFVFLALAAQYESWILPLAIILIVPLSALSAFIGILSRGMDNNILVQVGLVVLVGLAAKNAILIVEFARQLEREGHRLVEAIVEACRLRLRPILMTAFAFILGVVPLVVAEGPGAEMRQALGTAVFAGMLGVTFLGLFLTPVFYVVLRRLGGARRAAEPVHAVAAGKPQPGLVEQESPGLAPRGSGG
ncbi:MAG TPA: multidrug efflux RND transporter permease subunit [Azospirillaceae bacterium]|nr:multidrug efflux RND transporter permease subunit [Azospirillaceae bacterium]